MDAKKINLILDEFEKKDNILYSHSERVAMISYAFAQELNLSYDEREMAYFGGMLHDIGKFYSESVIEKDLDDLITKILNGSIIYFDNNFSKLIPIVSNIDNIEDDLDCEYNINIIKVIIQLADEYDSLRANNSHEQTCKIIRENNKDKNNMVTALLKSIIKNKLNYEY